jgi:hypothetical protein
MAQQRRKNAIDSWDTLTDTRVGVYNIFLTTDRELAENFSNYSSFSILQSDIEKTQLEMARLVAYGDRSRQQLKAADKRSLCLLSSDLNILDFTHEVNFSEGGGSAPVIKMKCVEPGLGILKKIFYLLMGQRISELKYRKNELRNQSFELDYAGYKAMRGVTDPYDPDTSISPLEAAEIIDKADIALQDHIRNNVNGQRVYIAYGIGDDLKYWGGPYSCILGQLEHSNNGKTETITYSFSPDHVSRQFDENPTGMGAETVNFKSLSLPIVAYKDDPNQVRSLLKFDGYTPSFHDNVVKLISNYLHQLGIRNHLIVLPNLDYILAPLAEQVLASRGWLEYRGGTLIDVGDDFQSEDQVKRYLYDVVFQTQRIFGLEGQGVDTTVPSWWIGGPKKASTKDIVELQKDFLAKVGLRANNSEKESSDVDPRLVNFEESSGGISGARNVEDFKAAANLTGSGIGTDIASNALYGFSQALSWVADSDLFQAAIGEEARERIAIEAAAAAESRRLIINDPFSTSTRIQNADAILSMELPFEADVNALDIETKELLKDGNFITHVEKFVQGIVNKNGGFVGRLSSFWENDVNVIKLFKEKWGSGTFVGYKDNTSVDRRVGSDFFGNEDLTGSKLDISDDSFFIFGDEDLIRDFLYGEIVHKVTYSSESRSVFDQVRRGVPYSYATLPKNYFLDPFWARLRGDIGTTFISATSKDLAKQKQTPKTQSEYKSKLGGTHFSEIQKRVQKADPTPFGYFNDYNIAKQQITKMLPDEFSFLNKGENSGALSDIFDLGIPFFLANTKNSNVLSYTFDADNFILAQFLGSINEIYYNMAYRYVKLGQKNPSLKGRMSSDAAFEKIYDVLDSIRKRGGDYGSRFKGLGLASPEVNLTKLGTDLTDILLMETVGLNRKVRRNYGSDTITICHLFFKLFESQFKGIIKTLPMYHLSSYSTLLKPAIVSLKSTPGLNIKATNDRSTADFFSGLYKILGFKHTISKSKGHSEFTLVKDVASTLSND